MLGNGSRKLALAITVALVALNLIAFNYLIAGWSTARMDLTSERLYSITPATKRVLTNLDEDLTITGFFSERTHPKLAPLVPEVEDLLEEYAAVSGGRVRVEIVDPGEDEEVEQEASERYGVRSTPFRLASKYESAIVNAYFALVIRFGDEYVRYGFGDLITVEPAPDGDIDVRLRNLEYDLTRAIKKVVFGFRGKHELFERIDGPVELTAIWTPDTLPEMFREVPDRLREAVAELSEAAPEGKIRLVELDPSSSEEDAVVARQSWGARPMSLGLFGEGEDFYLYAILDVAGSLEQIPMTGEDVTAATIRESIEAALKRHTPGYLKTIGVVTSDPPDIPPEIRMQMQLPPQPPPEFEQVKALLGEEYEVEDVDLSSPVPASVDTLLVLKPKSLAETELYSLDQYLMRGGRVVLCAGNYNVDFGQAGLSVAPIDTGLDDWLAHFGVTLDSTLVLDDRNQALPIPELRQTPFGTMRTWAMAPYPYLVQVREDGFLNADVTASLDAVGIYWGSPLRVDESVAPGLERIPLLQSSDRSWTDDDVGKVGFVDYQVPEEGTEPYLLGLALAGKFESYFADRPVPTPEVEEGEAAPPTVTLEESPPTRLVVIGNAEFLSDFVARALAQVDGGFFLENLRFAQNVIDWVGLDNEMLEIRSRGLSSRRLERVEESTKSVVEIVNYLIPLVILLVVAFWLHWRRRASAAGEEVRT